MITDFIEIENSAIEFDEKHRAELAKRLIKSLDEQVDEVIEQAWIDEVRRRKEEVHREAIKRTEIKMLAHKVS